MGVVLEIDVEYLPLHHPKSYLGLHRLDFGLVVVYHLDLEFTLMVPLALMKMVDLDHFESLVAFVALKA